ncbi:hypothetical protein P3S68_000746 [Capsicum galapagoense]
MASSGGGGEDGLNSINPLSLKSQKVNVAGIEENLDQDRISQLPAALLVQILSVLPTKDAYTTCFLSKRWRYVWTKVYNFIFTRRIRGQEIYRDPFDTLITRDENLIMEDAVFLSPEFTRVCLLPESFRTCSSLITLHLRHCRFNDVVIAWKYLKSLKLESLMLNESQIMNLLSGCPSLGTMELYDVGGFRRLEINSSNFKRLSLKSHSMPMDDNDRTLEIFAPYLEHLDISGNLEDLKCWLVDVSSLVNAKLTFYISCIKHKKRDRGDDTGVDEYSCHDYHQGFRILVQDYLQKLSCATELTIGSWFIEVPCMLQFNGLPVPELKCKYLTLELHMENFDLLGVAGLLRALRHVETLNIDMTDNHIDSSFCDFEEENTDLRSWISSFVFPNLKNVKIANFFQACLEVDSVSSVDSQKRKRSFDRLVELSELMLKNAMILEKFVIISKRRKCKSCLTNCESKFLLGLAEKLDFQDPPPIQ